MEENHRKKSGQKGPLEVIQSLLYSDQTKTGLRWSFLSSSENTRTTQTGTETMPSAQQPAFIPAAVAQCLFLQPLTGTDPLPAYPLWLESIFPAFMKINVISSFKSFPQSDRGKV